MCLTFDMCLACDTLELAGSPGELPVGGPKLHLPMSCDLLLHGADVSMHAARLAGPSGAVGWSCGEGSHSSCLPTPCGCCDSTAAPRDGRHCGVLFCLHLALFTKVWGVGIGCGY